MTFDIENNKDKNLYYNNLDQEDDLSIFSTLTEAKKLLNQLRNMDFTHEQLKNYSKYLNSAIKNLIIHYYQHNQLKPKGSLKNIYFIIENIIAFKKFFSINDKNIIHREAEKIIQKYFIFCNTDNLDKKLFKKAFSYYTLKNKNSKNMKIQILLAFYLKIILT